MRRLLTVLTAAALASPGSAETNLALMAAPWTSDSPLELNLGSAFISADADEGGAEIDLSALAVSGRFRPDFDRRGQSGFGQFTIGGELDYLDIGGAAGGLLPERMTDQAVAVGAQLGTFQAFDRAWAWGGSAGIGHASTLPFADDDGWYGLGAVYASTQLGDTATLMLGVDYDGNRVVFPDIPLPAVNYTALLSDTLTVSLGFPVNALIWTPTDRLRVNLTLAGINPAARVSYDLGEGQVLGGDVELFARYGAGQITSHIDGDADDRRLFYTFSVLEAGLQIDTGSPLTFTVSGGYSFDQAFERGFDLRETDDIVELDDAAFFRVGGGLSF